MKWLALIVASVVVLAVSMTALDKYDERTCMNGEVAVYPERADGLAPRPGSEEARKVEVPTIKRPDPGACGGFLPW